MTAEAEGAANGVQVMFQSYGLLQGAMFTKGDVFDP